MLSSHPWQHEFSLFLTGSHTCTLGTSCARSYDSCGGCLATHVVQRGEGYRLLFGIGFVHFCRVVGKPARTVSMFRLFDWSLCVIQRLGLSQYLSIRLVVVFH
jgi:hypothetical protein